MTQPLTPDQEALLLQQQANAQGITIPGMAGGPPPPMAPPPPAPPPPLADEREARLAAQADASAMQANAAGQPYKSGDLPVDPGTLTGGATAEQAGAVMGAQPAAQQAPQAGIAGGAVMVGGGYRPAGEIRAVGDKALEAFGDAQMMKAQAAQSQDSRALGQAMKDVVARDEAQAAHEKVATGAQAELDTLGQKRAEYEQKLAKIEDEGTRLAQSKIDPDRLWNSKSTGAQIAYTISAFLADIGTGLVGGVNPHREQLNKAIERDVDAQVRAYQAKEKNIEARRSLVGQIMRETNGDIQQTKAILRDAQIKKAMTMADYAAASAKTAGMQEKADALKIGLAEDHANFMRQAFPWQQAQASGGKQLVPVRTANGQIVYVSPEKALEYDTKQQELAHKNQPKPEAIDTDTRFVAQKLIERNVPDLRSAISNYGAAEAKHKPTGKEGLTRAVAGTLLPPTAASVAAEKLYGKNATATDQAWQGFVNQAIKIDAGSGVTGTELTRKEQELLATRDPIARANAIRNYTARAQAIENTALAGVSPEAARAYAERVQRQSGGGAAMPTSVRRDK